MNDTLQIVLALFGGGAVTTLITFFVNRKDKKDDKLRELEEKISKGLDERELTGKNRYLEHKEAILDLKTSHEEDYKNLFQALEQLTVIFLQSIKRIILSDSATILMGKDFTSAQA